MTATGHQVPGYGGLGQYQTAPADLWAPKPGESPEATRRRHNFWRGGEEVAITQEDWDAHRQVADNANNGLFGKATPTDRGAALGTVGAAFAGSQVVVPQGHLVRENNRNQPAPARVYRSETREPHAVSPLVRALRGDTAPSPEHERWA